MNKEEINRRLIFGLKLRQTRMERKMSLADLSKKTGISVSFLNEIEKGKKHPKPDKIKMMARAIDMTPEWLNSPQLDKELAPVSDLIHSNILYELPLEMFGLKVSQLLEMLSNAPSKLNAFISTLIEVSRNFDMRVETFYFSVMRSYQEIHENYFEDLEVAADKFLNKYDIDRFALVDTEILERLLVEEFNYQIIYDGFSEIEELKTLRSYLSLNGKRPKLYLNKELNSRQKAFIMGKELGFQFMGLEDRPLTSSWVEITAFDQVVNNFKASYFSTAILINREAFLVDLKDFLEKPTWDDSILVNTMMKYNATPEMLLQRLTNLLPKFFNIRELFFMRFHHQAGSNRYELSKELHLSGLPNPNGTVLHEHFCRRWMSISIFDELEDKLGKGEYEEEVGGAQRAQLMDTGREYLLFTIARPMLPTKGVNSSLTLGLLVNQNLRRQVKFLDDPAIKTKLVNETCERCVASDCSLRAAPPRVIELNERLDNMRNALKAL